MALEKIDYFGTFLNALDAGVKQQVNPPAPSEPPADTLDLVVQSLARRGGEAQIGELLGPGAPTLTALATVVDQLRGLGLIEQTNAIVRLTEHGRSAAERLLLGAQAPVATTTAQGG